MNSLNLYLIMEEINKIQSEQAHNKFITIIINGCNKSLYKPILPHFQKSGSINPIRLYKCI